MNTQPLEPLSERELEVLRLLAEGLSNREIAQRLTLSLETIKWYNRQIYSKLDVRGRTQAAARARELDLLEGGGPPAPSPHIPAQLPSFLTGQPYEPADQPLFVGRDRELASLEGFLAEALMGNGRTLFVEGSAGRGKSTLLAELTNRALNAHPNLLAATGSGSAFAGVGDPYLPFRELVALLTADVERHLEARSISQHQARRLWSAIPETVRTLLDAGPDLLDVFVSGRALLARARQAAQGSAPWLARLEEQLARPRPTDLEQSALFSQLSEFLRQMAKDHPLLILLDDLHWADDASLGLLFHLGRRLAGSRILVVGAYRPEGLAGGRDGQRHPLREVLGELQRTYGEITVDLAAVDQDEVRAFVDALLDAEPNQLDQAFREAFYRQTAGHPLFSVELLREMQKRGNLVQDEAGQWRQGIAVDWQTVPARIEAVIGQRLGHLDDVSRGILEVASVEGETFTAEVVAQVSQIDRREFVARVSRDLVRQHSLLAALGIERLNPAGRQITRYRFQHHLFQAYIYQELDEIQRSYLHEAVGSELETLYQDQLDEIATQLARHFQEAGNQPKAIEYLCRASERATRLAAFDEAIDGFSRALALVHTLADPVQSAQQGFRLYMGLADAQRKAGYFEPALESFQQAAALARESGSAEDLARAALGYEEARWQFNLPAGPAAELLEEALDKLDPAESILRVRVWVNLARTRMPTSSPERVESLLQQALKMARRANDPAALYEALYLNVRGNRRPEMSQERLGMLAEMLQLAETIGSYELAYHPYSWRALEYLERGDIDTFAADEQRYMTHLSSGISQPFYDYSAIILRIAPALLAGLFEEAERLAEQALEIGRQMRVENHDGVYGMQMFTIRREQGRLPELAPVLRLLVNQNPAAAIWRPGLALMFAELDMRPEAAAEFEVLALNSFGNLPRDALWVTNLVYLSEVCVYLGDQERAAILYELLSPYDGRNIVVGFFSGCLGAAARYSALLAMTLADWEAAEGHFEDALAMNEKMGARPWLAHTQYEYGTMLLSRGRSEDRDRAQALLTSALETAVDLGMSALVDDIEAQNKYQST
jgi:DNA-binding CsgD family transcriptional regulator/tetratricopeptide (TPR) repeat protein